ncbi:phosphotransferase family protein [Cytobacillus sp. Hm23]
MKKGWERSNEQIILNKDEITKMIKPFLDGRTLTDVSVLSGGLNNSNLKITTDMNQSYVLRCYAHDDIKGKIEQSILKFLRNDSLVPDVLYEDFTCRNFKTPFMIISWMDGIQLSEFMTRDENFDLIKDIALQIGKYLATLHSIEFSQGGFFDESLNINESLEINSTLYGKFIYNSIFLENGKRWLGEEFSNKVWDFVKEFAYLMDDLGNQSALVHSDFNPLNILVNSNEKVVTLSAILDWEYAFSGTPLVDIGNLLRYENTSSKIVHPLIYAYKESGGVLPSDWLKKAKLLDLIALCQLLNNKKSQPKRIEDIKRLILLTMEQWSEY